MPGRFFDTREECDAMVDRVTNPDAPAHEQLQTMMGGAGEAFADLLSIRNCFENLEKSFGGGSGNEVHDATTTGRMREPMAALKLAIDEVIEGTKDVTWSSETCTCASCKHSDKTRAAKYN